MDPGEVERVFRRHAALQLGMQDAVDLWTTRIAVEVWMQARGMEGGWCLSTWKGLAYISQRHTVLAWMRAHLDQQCVCVRVCMCVCVGMCEFLRCAVYLMGWPFVSIGREFRF